MVVVCSNGFVLNYGKKRGVSKNRKDPKEFFCRRVGVYAARLAATVDDAR